MSNNGYLATRRGLLDHLRDGRLTLIEKAAFQTVCELADWRTGVWYGSARALAAICGAGDLSEREARRLLESLQRKRYIRRFAIRGRHGNYPIVVHKYQVKVGEEGFRVDAWRTKDWRKPFLTPCRENGEVQGEENASSEEVSSNPKQKEGTRRRTASPIDAGRPPGGSFTPLTPPKKNLSRRENLEARLASKIAAGEFETITSWLDPSSADYPEYGAEARRWWKQSQTTLRRWLLYEADANDPTLTIEFVDEALEICEHAVEGAAAWHLCCRVIDRCMSRKIPWPPSFQGHRDRLKAAEMSGERIA